eukprot:COSAG01_NODE_1138_length_11546_cov_11.035206_5_plen_111_part_00
MSTCSSGSKAVFPAAPSSIIAPGPFASYCLRYSARPRPDAAATAAVHVHYNKHRTGADPPRGAAAIMYYDPTESCMRVREKSVILVYEQGAPTVNCGSGTTTLWYRWIRQ